jgi:hypothetical protein
VDNPKLQKYKTEFLLELLKGLHYILFTFVSINRPLFLIIHIITHILHHIFNKHAFNKPYEYSLLHSFLIVFLLIDYNNITKISLNDLYFIIIISCGFIIEPLFVKKEYSMLKIITRIYIIIIINSICIFSHLSDFIKHIIYFYNGYFLISIMCQFYSLFMVKEENQKKRKREKKIKINKRIRRCFRKLIKKNIPSNVLQQLSYLDN